MTAGAGPGDLPERLTDSLCRARLPRALSAALAWELALWTYALAGWRMRTSDDPRDFSVHRQSAWSMAAVGLGLVLAVEAIPMHFLLVRSHPALAWLATAATAYGLLWLIGDAHALRLRPLRLGTEALEVRIGLRARAKVPLAAIESVAPVRPLAAPPRRERGYLRATPLDDPSLLLTLRAPVTASGSYGIPHAVRRIGLAPDDRARFEAALRGALERGTPANGGLSS